MKRGKKILISSLVATSILVANTPSIKSDGLNQVKAKQEALNSFDIDLNQMGLAITAIKRDKDIDSYLVKIVEPNRFLEWVADKLMPRESINIKETQIADKLNGIRFMMDINWRLFKESKEDSIHIYPYIGSSDSASILKLLANDKKGIYLTINQKRGYFKGRLESINYTLKGSEQKYILWSGAGFECTKNSALKSCDIRGGKLALGQKSGSNPLNMQLEGLKCSYNIDNNFIGSEMCIFPKGELSQADNNSRTKIVIDGFKLENKITKDSDKTISYKSFLGLNNISIDNLENQGSFKFLFKDFQLNGWANGLDFQAYKKSSLLVNELNKKHKVDTNELKEVLLPLVAGGNKYLANLRLGLAKFEEISNNGTTGGLISNWRADYELELGKVIRYEEKNIIDKINFKDITPILDNGWEAKGVILNYGIDRLYNPIPKALDVILDIANNPEHNITSKQEQQLNSILDDILHQGIKAHISPITIKELRANNAPINSFGPALLDIRANLKPNQIDRNNPMAPMMFLGKFLANGELRLREKDFNAILPLIPSDFANMVNTLAKRENGEVIFKIRFENGALVVNGVPIPLM